MSLFVKLNVVRGDKMNTVFIVLTVSIALSYGWGMRGSLMGVEKGAMLPGALLGMFLALFSGSEIIARNFYIFAAVGAISMAFGGCETYGETLSFILHKGREEYAPKKGYAGVILKGSVWHGICGGFLGLMFSAAGGVYYKPVEIIIFIVLIPLIRDIGTRIFNEPFNAEKGKFPKIYFSMERREEWGGLLLTVVALLVFTALHKDFYAFFFTVTGILGGGLGFSLGMVFFCIIAHPNKKGKKFLGALNDKLEGWKTMEFTFGATGGLFFAVYFVATKNTMLAERINMIEQNGGIWSPLGDIENVLVLVSFVLVFLSKVLFIPKFKLSEYATDLAERPFLFVFPLLLTLLGSTENAKLVAFTYLVYYAAEKVIFDRSPKCGKKRRIIISVVMGVLTLVSLALQIFFELPPIAYILMYTVFYIFADNITEKRRRKSGITVFMYFVIQSLYIISVVAFCDFGI